MGYALFGEAVARAFEEALVINQSDLPALLGCSVFAMGKSIE
jgi:hypothetical protein